MTRTHYYMVAVLYALIACVYAWGAYKTETFY